MARNGPKVLDQNWSDHQNLILKMASIKMARNRKWLESDKRTFFKMYVYKKNRQSVPHQNFLSGREWTLKLIYSKLKYLNSFLTRRFLYLRTFELGHRLTHLMIPYFVVFYPLVSPCVSFQFFFRFQTRNGMKIHAAPKIHAEITPRFEIKIRKTCH